jgi:ABC-2 type transport system ATP-binding protein
MNPSDVYIETLGLTKTFRDFWLRARVTAVADLDLQVCAGEVFGLLGPNGSGKSTTLKLILGLLFPSKGKVAVFGKRPTDVRSKRRIGFLPEESYLYPFLSARETLDYYGRLFKLPRRERQTRVDMLLDMVGLEAVAYRPVGEYSKGMQRRIGLAQALINDPDLLILDEPTSGMDPVGSREFKDLIRTLAGRGKTVLLSSHLLADVEEVCDRVCVLYGGRKRAHGTLDELLAQHGRRQLMVDDADEAMLENTRQSLVRAGAKVEISVPQDRLETLFLRIVSEAQESRLPTGGVAAGAGVAEFLREGPETPQAVIEELVASSPAQPVEEPTPEHEPVVEPDRGEIDALMTEAAPQAPESAPEPLPEHQDHADRSVIDDLLGGDSEKGT